MYPSNHSWSPIRNNALILRRELGDRHGITLALCMTSALENLRYIALGASDALTATRLFGGVHSLQESIDLPWPPSGRADWDVALAKTRSTLGDAPFALAWEEGKRMTTEEVVALAWEAGLGCRS